MKTDTIIKLLSSRVPYTPESAMMECKLPLKYLGSGAYRHVYHITGTKLILKFPCLDTRGLPSNCNIEHARNEYDAVSRITGSSGRKYSSIKKHMPALYYHNCCSGLILGEKYKLLSDTDNETRAALSKKVCRTLKMDDCDITNYSNVGVDRQGTLKLLDCGYLMKQ